MSLWEKNIKSKMSNAHKLSLSGGALKLFCFFLPWLLISCSGTPLTELSGPELAAGTTISMGQQSSALSATPSLFIVPGVGLFAVALAFVKSRESGGSTLGGPAMMFSALLAAGVLFWNFARSNTMTSDGPAMTQTLL
jgi:hypothetical protein